MNKKPWVAAILNLIFFGAGYIYNGKRVGLGIALTIAVFFVRYGEINIFLTHLVGSYYYYLMVGITIIQISFAVDAYKEAKSRNQ